MGTKSGKAARSPAQIDIKSVHCMGISSHDRRKVFGMNDGSLIVLDTMNSKNIVCGFQKMTVVKDVLKGRGNVRVQHFLSG